MNNLGTSIIIATAIASGAYFLTHLHSVVPTQTGVYAYVVNHVTGSVKLCYAAGCSYKDTTE